MTKFQTDYGGFSDDGSEYIITRADTPMPWINVITNSRYGMVVSQAGGGYSWLIHASLNRITRWEQDMIRDRWGKFIYIRDQHTGAYWSLARQPAGDHLQDYRVIHGMGYTTFEAEAHDIQSELTYTVPLDDPCELWIVRLQNTGDQPRSLRLYTYLEWNLGASPDWHREFHRLFTDVTYRPEAEILLATKDLWEVPGVTPAWNTSWPYVAFHSASLPLQGFDGNKKTFMGRNNDLETPAALRTGEMAGEQGRWVDAIGSLCVQVDLQPGQTQEVVFVLGAVEEEEQVVQLANRYKDVAAARAALLETRRFWQGLTGSFHMTTPDEAFNLLGNTWLVYQAVAGRLWGRTAYYQTGGAYGYRDQLQDSLVWLLLGKPEATLAQIVLHAAHQYQEGIVLHWWHPLADQGQKSKYSDDLLWLPFVTLHYLYETGDMDCLNQQIPFFDQGQATLLEHCLLAIRVALKRRSGRGLPHILAGDWNDGMNAVGDKGRGESIWMAHFLHYLLVRWAGISAVDDQTRQNFLFEAEALKTAANEYAWDGKWFWRASTDEGEKLGSIQSKEGQIYLNAQTWAVLSGITTRDRQQQAMRSAREHLYTSYGALIFKPAYTQPDPKIGYLTRYAPGLRENGGVYFHASCWAILAERKLHSDPNQGAQAAYDLWRKMSPILCAMQPDRYQAEPYVTPGNKDGPLSPFPGRAGWTWYTGSGQWFLRVMIEGVLGVEAAPDGLRVSPGLPEEWPMFRLQRPYRGGVYDITVRRVQTGEQTGCWLNGQPYQQEALPPPESGQTIPVEYRIAA